MVPEILRSLGEVGGILLLLLGQCMGDCICLLPVCSQLVRRNVGRLCLSPSSLHGPYVSLRKPHNHSRVQLSLNTGPTLSARKVDCEMLKEGRVQV